MHRQPLKRRAQVPRSPVHLALDDRVIRSRYSLIHRPSILSELLDGCVDAIRLVPAHLPRRDGIANASLVPPEGALDATRRGVDKLLAGRANGQILRHVTLLAGLNHTICHDTAEDGCDCDSEHSDCDGTRFSEERRGDQVAVTGSTEGGEGEPEAAWKIDEGSL